MGRMDKIRDTIYYIGVIITALSWAGIAESFTGHGSTECGLVFLVIGLAMILQRYIKDE